MEAWIDTLNFNGLLIGALTFLIIGASHPAVIKGEYYFGTRIWWAFLLLGLLGIAAAVYFWACLPSPACGASRRSSNNRNGCARDGSRAIPGASILSTPPTSIPRGNNNLPGGDYWK